MVKCRSSNSGNSCRSFQVFGSGIGYISPTSSYYKGKEPGIVAKKFGSMLFRLINDEKSDYYKYRDQSSIKFIMREKTKGSDKATFYYKAERIELPTPVKRTLPDGTVIINRYKTIVHKCGNDQKINTQTANNTQTITTPIVHTTSPKEDKSVITKAIIVEKFKIKLI
jgi:hypothetical protein